MTAKYILIKKLAKMTGYTENAIRCKIKKGVWLEGVHWLRAPDNRILLNHAEITKWIEGDIAV